MLRTPQRILDIGAEEERGGEGSEGVNLTGRSESFRTRVQEGGRVQGKG